jgi:hypothetical protein
MDLLTIKKPPGWDKLPLYRKIKYYSRQLDSNYSIYVDKLSAKEIVKKETLGNIKTAETVKILKSFDDITVDDICENYILKASHGSGWNIDLKETTDISEIISKLHSWNKTYSTDEKQYIHIEPRFFIEKKLTDLYLGKTGNAIVYMVRCIYGNPVSIGVKDSKFNYLYTIDWKSLLSISSSYEQPKCLDLMLMYSRVLSRRFEFVRLDFYICENNEIYFSEFTFTPAGGSMVFPLPLERIFGELWT